MTVPKSPSEPQQTLTAPSKVTVAEAAVIQGNVSFNFDDADIFEVAKTVFGDVLRVNYIIDSRVTGRVNFRTVTPIAKSDVLSVMEVIFRLSGIGFLVEEGLYRIVPINEVSRELVFSQVGKEPGNVAMELFTFKNLNLKDSMKDIENALGLSVKGGKIRVLPIYRLNALLVVASTKEQLDYVRKWVTTFDQIFNGAKPKVYVYPVQNSKAANVATLLQEIFLGVKAPGQTSSSSKNVQQASRSSSEPAKPQTSAGGNVQSPAQSPPALSMTPSGGESLVSEVTRIFPDEIANSIIILATPEDYELISETIMKIDVVPRQVMIEALVAEIKLTDDMTFGLAWSLKTDLKINRDINLDGNLGFNSSKLSKLDVSSLAGFAFAGVDSAGVVRTLLESLASDAKVKVLASPHILVSDNREAKIQVGDQVPIATSQTNVAGTTDIQTTIQYKDTGIILKVKPQINEGGLVALDVSQEVSNFSTQKILGSDQVVISKREAATNLVIQDGQTIVIGGLIREDSSKSRDGIPFLSKIPLLGYLFGSTSDKYTSTELVILITPRVIRNQAEAARVSSDYMRKAKKTRQEIDRFRSTNESDGENSAIEKQDAPDVR
ncbi:MAG: hypothetical protein HZB62_06835 [Nitrospirae bacterium]|nr:hypothetical protein [Nitrospirota bacterium]